MGLGYKLAIEVERERESCIKGIIPSPTMIAICVCVCVLCVKCWVVALQNSSEGGVTVRVEVLMIYKER